MDDVITCTILGFEGLFFSACFVILIFLIVKRVKTKKKETFEKRNN